MTTSTAVKYIQRPADRAPYKLEARIVTIDGREEMRLFDANGNPAPELTDQLLTSLREKGLDLSGVEVTTHGSDPFHIDTRTLP